LVAYVDTSAFLKLIRSEPESRALREELSSGTDLVSSALLMVESRRAAARYGALALARTRSALATITLLPLDDRTLEAAADLSPPLLRSLEALHLATAVGIGADLGPLYCYDARLARAALELGLDARGPA
jgi:predicted nucleic acid-binding protein